MSEEEILEILKEFNKIKINSYAMQFVNISYPKLQMAIQGLLDLYETEKEKNKELEKYQEGYKLLTYSLDNYISKDKIKAKIEEISNGTYDAKIILQQLLEESESNDI